MTGGIHKLKPRTITTVKKQGLYNDGGGLYLSVAKGGSKSWTYIWSERGKRRQMGLGGLTSVSVSRAREKAQLARESIADGKNPIKERDRNTDRTFGACADKLIKDNEKSWKHEKHRAQWLRTVNHYCADLRDKQVADIDTQDVLGAIKPIWTEKPETARRLRARIERILDFAGSHGWRTGDNPARWKGHLKNIMPLQAKGGNYAALPYVDVPSFMKDLKDKDTISARALEFTILTAARTGETIGAKWTEIDFDGKLWTIPAERMKAKLAHEVPLTDPVLAMLEKLQELKLSDYIFHGQKLKNPLSNMAMASCLKSVADTKCTVHGFRSTFRDWAGDKTNFQREIAEAALAHKVGNSVEQAYRRGTALEKRRVLMNAWTDYCNGENLGKVVKLHG